MTERRRETSSALSSGEPVETKLRRIARKSRNEPGFQFTSLFHLVNEEMLRDCFQRLRSDAAAGIDGLTKAAYAENLDANISHLKERLQRMAYRPQPVRRRYIPKPGTAKQRPLGIPCLEDKLVQAALVRILEHIYEQDFIEHSYGFRPGRSGHDALRTLNRTVGSGNIHFIVEADIKGFFDSVDHEWMMKFVAHRVRDKRVLRMISRFLKAGVVENGVWQASDEGTPQGGVISPLLANVYLHYVLDLWFERRFKKGCSGQVCLIRYADDFVGCFECESDAKRFRMELEQRLSHFNLELELSKTKVLAFGPRAIESARRQGARKPETFDFLGFTHYCGRSRNGKRFRVKRVTARKRLRAKLAVFKQWLKTSRAKWTNRELWKIACAKLRGHYSYYGVTDNSQGIGRFAYETRRLLFKWLNRQGGKRRMNWEKFALMEKRFPLPVPRITVSMF